MIATILTALLPLGLTIINFFIKNAEKNKEAKEKMFKMAENHSKNVIRNVKIRRDLEELKDRARSKKPDSKIS